METIILPGEQVYASIVSVDDTIIREAFRKLARSRNERLGRHESGSMESFGDCAIIMIDPEKTPMLFAALIDFLRMEGVDE